MGGEVLYVIVCFGVLEECVKDFFGVYFVGVVDDDFDV